MHRQPSDRLESRARACRPCLHRSAEPSIALWDEVCDACTVQISTSAVTSIFAGRIGPSRSAHRAV